MRNGATLAGVYDRGRNDYLSRMTAHYANASAMHEARRERVPGELSYSTKWESPQALRAWAHEQELAQECWDAHTICQRRWSRAMFRAWQHRCLLAVRDANELREKKLWDRRTLAQVASDHAGDNCTHASNAPPGNLRDLSALATCHASNAPGLFTHPRQLETAPT